ncbi:MAG: helix-hairpin-helix domain-containing protein [Acidobacteriota bacterium]|nr:helix-hairpin-helix domain-containing protein [Acidobacteriota bacterium]
MRAHVMKSVAVIMVLGLFLSPLLAMQGANKSADKININSAPSDELQKLPQVGPKVAQRIIDFRKQNGPFKKTEELMKVQGIGEKIYAKLKDLITV